MEIWDAKGNKVLDSVVTQNAEHVEELMQADYVSLQWVSNVKRVLPAGAYIVPFDDGVRYMLLDPYTPDQNNTDEFTYSPQFQHPKMYLGRVPYSRASKDTEGNDINLLDWDYKGYLTTFLSDLCGFITKTFTDEGITTDKFSYSVLGDIEGNVTISISNNDILSVLNNVCNTLDCEWHIDWEQRRLFVGNVRFDKNEGETLELTSGVNVGMASVSSQSDTYYNVYLPQGSTRNMAAATSDGSYYATNRRLELDPEKYPDGKIYTDGGGNVVTKEQFLEAKLPKLVQTLMLDEIYPKIDLYVYDVRNRERYLLDDNGDKVIDHYEGETPVYKRYAIWYMRLAYPIYNTDGTIRSWKDATLGDTFKLIDGYTLMCSFGANTDSTLTSPLAGREFELNYVETDKEAKELSAKADSDKGDTGVEVKKGDYEIIYTTEGNLIIPTTEEQGLVPKGESSPAKNGNKVTIFNVVMGEDFIKAAQNDLEVAAIREIKKQYSDLNQYTFNSDNVAFKKDMPSLYIGRSIKYNDGVGNTLDTRIMKLTTKLDFPFMVEITVGNKVLKGSTSQLKTDVQMILSGNRQTASNGITESVVRSLIKGFGGANFLSKVNDDTARGIITFLQGTNWGSFTSETGAAMTVDPTTGQTYMEVDRLKVRLKAFFEQLEVQKVGYVGGKIVVSKGQGVDILDVEEIYDSEGNLSAYRCYFLGEQEGRKIDNLLRVNDQMICKDENISESSTDGATNKYYWRLVTAVSSDVVKRGNNVCHWVDLSATDYDTISDDVPEIGDTICQLGNRNDIDRQGAEVLSVVDANSPSFTIYSGINSYSLVNKEYIDMGVSGGKAFCNIYGSTYIGDRNRENGYISWDYDKEENVWKMRVKGTIDITSQLSSGGTIGGAINNAANAYKDDFSTFTSNVNEIIGGFQAQIDGVIETWFYDPEPTLGNLPASEWKDNDTKDKHLGDLYYSKDGLAYRFQKEGDIYKWVRIDDTAITSALKEAKAAKDAAAAAQGTADTAQTTANSKMKVFVVQPTNNDEYSVGDMWVNATYPADGSTYNNEILHCVTTKAAGEAFSISHWAQSSNIKTQFNNFVNNTYAEDKKDFYNQLDGKVETWYQSADPKDKWETADYSKHKGDIWYNDSTNKSYRWTGIAWVELKDQAAIDAKALAESKRRVFTTTTLPTPPYDARDLWVQGENGDIMVCVTPKAAGTTASASDWEKASKYTDDTKANEALAKVGDLQTDVTELGESFNTLTNTTLPALSDGIITTSEKENIRQALMQVQKECVDVINAYTNLTVNYKSIYDKIAEDVRTNFATAYTNLMGSATLSSDGTITYTSGQGGAYGALVDNINALLNKEGNLTTNEIATINNNIANFNIKYNDFQNRLVVVRNDIEKTLDTRITDVDEQLGGYAYLKKIVGGKTTIDGGLVLTTMLGTGYEVTGGAYKIMSGISGLYETAKSVAIWAGGSMIDKFVYYDAESGKFNVPADVNPANFLVRMDGTGYAAGGNFWWDNDGKIHADPQSFLINEQYVGNVMQLFQLHYKVAGDTAFTNVDYVTPTRMFNGLELSDLGLKIGDTAKFYIKDGVLFLEGDLAVTGGITMYATDGVTSGLLDQVYAILDSSKFEIKNGVITIKGDIGDGKVKGATLGGIAVTLNANGILEFDAYPTTLPASDVYAWAKAANKPTYSWGEITEKPSSFTPSAHTHDDRYYTESEIDTKLGLKLDTSLKGAADGLATLDASGKVPSAQLPSYVDDVLECINKASFPTTGESGKIYIDQTTNLTYRWGGTAYVEISQSLALGETSSTAYAGDKGKQNAADIATLKTGKADKATTLAGYGITDAYTKTEVNTKLTDGSVTKVGKVDVGSATKPIYLKAGVPTAVGTSLAVDITGNSATASKLKTAVTLWGQSFDGSEAISGEITDASDITMSGALNLNGITIEKTSNGLLKINGDLIVTGGITMYSSDGSSIDTGFGQMLADYVDNETIVFTNDKLRALQTGTVKTIVMGSTTYTPNSSGVVTLPEKVTWANIEGKPSTFAPSSHTHTFASLTSKPTTLSGYGITDAKIANGVITLGTATITPLTAHQTVTLASGTNNGTLKLTVNGTATDNIAVKGLGSAAYTASSAYATAGHTHNYAGSASAGGAAYSANKVNSRGNLTAYAEGATTMGESGVNLYTVYNNGYPVTYGNLLHIYGSGAGQLLTEWCGNSSLGHLYYRSKRDNADNGWSAWGKVAFVTDNVASASKWATARKITLTGSVTGEVSIDGSGNVSLATTTNHTHSYVPLSGGTMTGNLILKGGTSADMTYAGNVHPSIRFDNSDSSQNVSLIFTDYDSYRAPAGLKLVGSQGNEWFEAANIYATTFHGALSGNAATASKLGTSNVGSGTQHFYLSGGTATASTSTVGGTAKPMYLKAGVMTAISATVGSTSLPVYLNAGTITACGTSLGVSITGNAATATTLQNARTLWGQSFNGSANISGNMSGVGQITFSDLTGTNGRNLLYQKMADNDYFRIYCGGTGNNGGYAEIATADDGNEPIYVRQYSGEFSTLKRTLTLLDGNGNTTVPGLLTAANGTVNGTLKVGAIPVTNSSTGVLKIDGSLIVTGGITMYATDGSSIDTGFGQMLADYVDNETIVFTNDKLRALQTGTVKTIVMGSTTYTPNSSGAVTLPEKVTWANIEGKPSTFAPSSHTHSSITIPVCSSLNGNSDVFSVEYVGGKNSVATKPSGVDAFGVMRLRTASGWYGQIMMSANTAPGIYYRNANGLSSSVGWVKLLDSGNFGDYAAAKSHTHSYLPLSGGTMTGAINLSNTNAKLAFGVLTTSPITGYKAPALLSNGVGIYSRYGGSQDEGAIIITEDTCVIYNSADTGWNFQVMDKDLGTDLTNDATRSFGVNQAHQAWSLAGFVKSGSSDSYVLLGGGGHKAESSLSVASAATATKLTSSAGSATLPIYFSDGKPVACTMSTGNGAGIVRSFGRGAYTSANQYFGNGTIVTIDPKGTGCISANDTILSLGDLSIRNTQLLVAYDRDGVYYRRITDSLSYGDWKRLAFTTDNVASASKWATARTITLTGSVTGSVSIDGSGDVTLATTTNHTHSYLPLSGGTVNGNFAATGKVTFLNEAKLKMWNVTSTRNSNYGAEMVFVQTSIDSADPETTWPDKNRNDLFLQPKGGHVHIGPVETAQNYTCYVAGTLRATDTITAPTFSGALSGNAATASKWATARTLTLTGSVTGSVSIDGSGNVSLATTTNHTHSYLPLAGGTMTGTIKYGGANCEIIRTGGDDTSWRGGLKYSWSGNTTIALWGKNSSCQFVWHAGTDFSSNDVNGTATRTYDFQVGRANGILEALIGGNKIWHAGNDGSGSGLDADKLDGEHSSAFAHIGAHNNLMAAGNEFTFASSGFTGEVFINYRTAGGTNGNISKYTLFNGAGHSLGTIIHTGNYSSYALPLSGGTMTAGARISHADGNMYLGRADNNGWVMCQDICSQSGSGDTYWSLRTNGTLHAKVIITSGDITAGGGITMYSDLRKKNVISDEVLSVKEIAAAPLFRHTYKSDDNQYIHVGTSAQYWSGIHEDWFTRKDSEGYYQMELQNLGVAMGISLAREIVTFEGAFKKYESKTDKKIRLMRKKINELEKTNESLEARVKELEERRTA